MAKKPKMPTDDELLLELASLDEASAYVPTYQDHMDGRVPQWCELVVELVRNDGGWPLAHRLPLRRHDGELIIEVLWKVLHPRSGMSFVPMLEHELDGVIDSLMNGGVSGKHAAQLRGKAEGLTLALAILAAPYAYDIDAIKTAAMARLERRS